jgi:hypothetical protein
MQRLDIDNSVWQLIEEAWGQTSLRVVSLATVYSTPIGAALRSFR